MLSISNIVGITCGGKFTPGYKGSSLMRVTSYKLHKVIPFPRKKKERRKQDKTNKFRRQNVSILSFGESMSYEMVNLLSKVKGKILDNIYPLNRKF